MEKIQFLESIPQSDMPEKEIRRGACFEKGSIHELIGTDAYRWVRRNKAVYYNEKPATKAAPVLKLNRPMMGVKNIDLVSDSMPTEVERKAVAEYINPPKKKAGRPKKVKKDPGVTPKNIGPALPVTGGGKSGGPGWDDA